MRNQNEYMYIDNYHLQTSSSSSFFFRRPVEELTVGFDSFFGVTFSCLTLDDGVLVGFLTGLEFAFPLAVDDEALLLLGVSFFTGVGFDFCCCI